MLFLLSPAKSLDYDTPTDVVSTEPLFAADAAALIRQLRTQTPAQLAGLMSLSDKLATLNVARYAAWRRRATPDNSKPAVLAFNGDVYDGLQARTLPPEALAWAQEHVVILSGLYGVLRPLDALQPYRLEMGTRWANPRGRDLYAWWGDRIAEHLNKRQAREETPVIINLASQEYARAALRPALRARVVECVFQDGKAGDDSSYKIISFHAKKARGLMARYAITHRIDRPQALRDFDLEGYRYADQVSAPDRLVFRRSVGDTARMQG